MEIHRDDTTPGLKKTLNFQFLEKRWAIFLYYAINKTTHLLKISIDQKLSRFLCIFVLNRANSGLIKWLWHL